MGLCGRFMWGSIRLLTLPRPADRGGRWHPKDLFKLERARAIMARRNSRSHRSYGADDLAVFLVRWVGSGLSAPNRAATPSNVLSVDVSPSKDGQVVSVRTRLQPECRSRLHFSLVSTAERNSVMRRCHIRPMPGRGDSLEGSL